MRQVYSPADPVEAHMLAHLLDQAGISAHIHGEALHGAAGDLPVANLIQLMVPDDDYERARGIVLAWEKQTTAEDAEAARDAKAFPLGVAITFAAIGAVFALIAKAAWDGGHIPIDSAVEPLDQNGDGRTDFTYFYRGVGQPAYKSEGDSNFDGRIDFVAHYDTEGVPQRDQRDNDFDGVFETHTLFRDGIALRSDIDTNRDGETDMRVHFRNGVVEREEISNLQTGRVARVNFYANSLLESAETDLDGDGAFETVTRYDRFGQPIPSE